MIADKQRFQGIRIYIDGSTFTDCEFEQCELVYSGTMGVQFLRPMFRDSSFILQGSAKHTLAFLHELYQSGLTKLVDAAVDDIRKGSPLVPESERQTMN